MRRALVFAWAGMLGFILIGCGDGGGKKGGGGGTTEKSKEKGSAKKGDVKVIGYTTVKGKVTYNGAEPAAVEMANVDKDKDKCPAQVQGPGWYVKDGAVQYAFVSIKVPRSVRKESSDASDPASPLMEIRQPHCQFEPRVMFLHPKQDLKVFNDGSMGITHDTNFTGKSTLQKTLLPGADLLIKSSDLRADDTTPYKIACGQHPGFMSAYLWKTGNPWGSVTNANGEFELKGVPVIEGGDVVLTVWHEKLPGNGIKDIGTLELKADEPATKDIAIPK